MCAKQSELKPESEEKRPAMSVPEMLGPEMPGPENMCTCFFKNAVGKKDEDQPSFYQPRMVREVACNVKCNMCGGFHSYDLDHMEIVLENNGEIELLTKLREANRAAAGMDVVVWELMIPMLMLMRRMIQWIQEWQEETYGKMML